MEEITGVALVRVLQGVGSVALDVAGAVVDAFSFRESWRDRKPRR
ncbi:MULTISPECIES: hypothetical protein [unclassified Streptomyces]|nr:MULTISPECIES: hypothetical protein [unclassified Streptomyces]